MNEALDRECMVKFENTNLTRQLDLQLVQIENAQATAQLSQTQMRYTKERVKELENQVEHLTRENGVMRQGLISFEAKNRELVKKLEKVLHDSKKVSVMDFKVAFDRVDRNMEKTKILLEIASLREHELNGTIKASMKGRAEANVGTDLRNVKYDIVYKNEHGLGILKHQETQASTE